MVKGTNSKYKHSLKFHLRSILDTKVPSNYTRTPATNDRQPSSSSRWAWIEWMAESDRIS